MRKRSDFPTQDIANKMLDNIKKTLWTTADTQLF